MSWALSSVGLERFLDTEEVAGSNPVEPTLFFPRCVAQSGSALRSGRRGRWFESSHTDRKKDRSKFIFGLFYNALSYSLVNLTNSTIQVSTREKYCYAFLLLQDSSFLPPIFPHIPKHVQEYHIIY